MRTELCSQPWLPGESEWRPELRGGGLSEQARQCGARIDMLTQDLEALAKFSRSWSCRRAEPHEFREAMRKIAQFCAARETWL